MRAKWVFVFAAIVIVLSSLVYFGQTHARRQKLLDKIAVLEQQLAEAQGANKHLQQEEKIVPKLPSKQQLPPYFLHIVIPTISRRNNPDYLQQTMASYTQAMDSKLYDPLSSSNIRFTILNHNLNNVVHERFEELARSMQHANHAQFVSSQRNIQGNGNRATQQTYAKLL